MADELRDGFDSSRFEDEITELWGQEAFDAGAERWRRMTPEGRAGHAAAGIALAQDIARAFDHGADPAGNEVQTLMGRHHSWVAHFWNPNRDAYIGLAELYGTDGRFRDYYEQHVSGDRTRFRDFLISAMRHYAEHNLS